MNTWFVANDSGVVAGHDMTETGAKALVEILQNRPEFYYLSYGDGMVSADNEPTIDLDAAMKFDTEAEATEKLQEIKNDWAQDLKVAGFIDDTWEAMSADE